MSEFFQYVVNGMVVGGVYAVVAIGFVTIYNVSKIINLAQGEFLMLGSMITISLLGMNVSYGAAIIFSVLLVTIIAILIQKYFISFTKRATPITLIILTIGISILVRGIAGLIWGKDSYPLPPLSGTQPVIFGGVSISQQSLWILLTVVVILTALWMISEKTLLGKKIKACSVNPMATRLMGISPITMAAIAFGLSGATGALAGIVIAPLGFSSYDMGVLLGIKGFSAAIVGGLGNPVGAVVCGFLLGLLESLGAGFISSGAKDALAFLILLTVLLVKPTGLFGERTVGKGGL